MRIYGKGNSISFGEMKIVSRIPLQKRGFIQHHFLRLFRLQCLRDVLGRIQRRNGAGFTLVEVLVVVAVIGFIMSIVLVYLRGTTEEARVAGGKQFGASVEHALGSFTVGMWRLEEGVGDSAQDASGFGISGNLGAGGVCPGAAECPLWRTESECGLGLGKCLEFLGNDYVEIPNAAHLENVQEGNYTLSVWYYPNFVPPAGDTNTATHGIMIKRGWHSGLSYLSSKKFRMGHYLVGDISKAVTSGNVFEPLRWHHIVGVVNKDAKMTIVYVNGRKEGELNWGAGDPTAREYTTRPWRIGVASIPAESGTNQWYANGKIDGVYIYSNALNAEAVGRMYAAEASRYGIVLQNP